MENMEYVFERIKIHWDNWMEMSKIPKDMKWVVAISGGKDSTIVAALAVKIFGKDRVIGVTLPCDGQKDFDDSLAVINHLGIKHISIDIGDAYYSVLQGIENNALDVSYDTKTNLPARLRMATTFAVAQSVGGMVLNTSNLTETIVGYCSLFGDDCGSYAPIKGLTVTEVIALGDWLGVPYHLTHKVPIDGLQPLTDEEKLGMKYSDIDKLIRTTNPNDFDQDFIMKVCEIYRKNKFKSKIVNVPGEEFEDELNFFSSLRPSDYKPTV